METTSVINIRNDDRPFFYIGRMRGEYLHFGNPFSQHRMPHVVVMSSRAEAIKAFREWLEGSSEWAHIEPERRQWILANLEELRGHRLGCYCHPLPCHGDVYVSMLEDK